MSDKPHKMGKITQLPGREGNALVEFLFEIRVGEKLDMLTPFSDLLSDLASLS